MSANSAEYGFTGKVTKVETIDSGGIATGFRVGARDTNGFDYGWEIEFFSPVAPRVGATVTATVEVTEDAS